MYSEFTPSFAETHSVTPVVVRADQARSAALLRLDSLGITSAVLWGHPLASHTHSYIHAAFAKAFRSLGLPTVWHDGKTAKEIPDNAIVITEGQVCGKLPANPRAFYVLHNVNDERFKRLPKTQVVALQVVHNAQSVRDAKPIDGNPVQRIDFKGDIYMSWASDMLPEEIPHTPGVPFSKRTQEVRFIGTVDNNRRNRFQNGSELMPFLNECVKAGIKDGIRGRRNLMCMTFEENAKAVGRAAVAPAIVGHWQREHAYVPCRLFKNITYGALPVTNSEMCKKVIPEAVWEQTPRALAKSALKTLKDHDATEATWSAAVERVRTHHTYVNRIAALAFAFQEKKRLGLGHLV